MRHALFVAPEVAGIRALLTGLVDVAGWTDRPVADQIDALATRLHAAHTDGDPRMAPVPSCWHPDLIGASPAQVLATPLTADDLRLIVARELGFEGPDDAVGLVHAPAFEAAVDAVVHGDVGVLAGLLDTEHGLATARSAYGHRATLLHYVGANGVETWRQVVPGSAARIAEVLLDAGAEVDAVADMYGGATTLALAASSGHTRQAGVLAPLERLLVDRGAAGDAMAVGSRACVPILPCSSVAETFAVFTEALGFAEVWSWGEPLSDAAVALDRAEIQLAELGQGAPGTWVRAEVDDVDVYAASVDAARVEVLVPPTDQPWGVREFVVRVPDRHVVRFTGALAGG